MRWCLIAAMIAAPATAGTVTFETENGFSFIRCRQSGTSAVCEILASEGAQGVCVAVDAGGAPIGTDRFNATFSFAMFYSLEAARIADVYCRPD